MRILHWNIHSWQDASGASNKESVIDTVRSTEPDVVSLVEVDEPWGEPKTLREVARRLGYAWLFTPAFEFGGAEDPAGGFGNAILTKLPILAVQQWSLTWPTPTYDGTEPSEARTVVFAELDFDHKPVWIGSTHLPRHDTTSRTAALRQLMTLTERIGKHWLLCGDFNTPADWVRRYTQLTTTPGHATYPADAPTEALDYAVAPSHMAIDAIALSRAGSDHLPILVSARERL